MKKFIALLTAVALLSVTSLAQAATVHFQLILDGAGSFELRAGASQGDNFGIASYSAHLENFLTIDHNSPRDGFAQGPSGTGSAGFTSLRTPDDNASGVVFASQDTILPTPNLIRGFGQTANSFAGLNISDFTNGTQLEQPEWDANLLVATGTYNVSGPAPGFKADTVELFSNVFSADTGATVIAADVTTEVVSGGPIIPEPATLAMAGMSLIGLVLRRRNG